MGEGNNIERNYSTIVDFHDYFGNILDSSKAPIPDYGMQHYQQVDAEHHDISLPVTNSYRAPVIPKFIEPLFPAVIRLPFLQYKKIQLMYKNG